MAPTKKVKMPVYCIVSLQSSVLLTFKGRAFISKSLKYISVIKR